jgi:hypothetical protein
LRAALVASALRGALPPVDLRAVCLVRAIAELNAGHCGLGLFMRSTGRRLGAVEKSSPVNRPQTIKGTKPAPGVLGRVLSFPRLSKDGRATPGGLEPSAGVGCQAVRIPAESGRRTLRADHKTIISRAFCELSRAPYVARLRAPGGVVGNSRRCRHLAAAKHQRWLRLHRRTGPWPPTPAGNAILRRRCTAHVEAGIPHEAAAGASRRTEPSQWRMPRCWLAPADARTLALVLLMWKALLIIDSDSSTSIFVQAHTTNVRMPAAHPS